MQSFDFQHRSRVVFGAGRLAELGAVARQLDFRRPLLVADHGLLDAGHVAEASRRLKEAGVEVIPFYEFDVNPDSTMIELGRAFAARHQIDSIVGLGGGSSLDCAKGINFVLTNGGTMHDYRGYGKAAQALLPMIGIPTTAGTGSEAQSYALISDARTREKMACGDPKAAFRLALLDPLLTLSQPAVVTAATGYDAIAHAVETFVCVSRNPMSECFSREAWRLLAANYGRVVTNPDDVEARAAMQLGAHLAGAAIENSMLGATHACANPLTARYDVTHGLAIAALLPSVVRWNDGTAGSRYAELIELAGWPLAVGRSPGDALAERLRQLADTAALPGRLAALGIVESDLGALARDAAEQWTGRFNPRPFDANGALEVYRCAF